MVAIRLVLPHGRYHATPWGHHVNEGVVEWPPSPWRILRALVATGYTKLGWAEVPPAAVELLTILARSLPVYRLPPATVAHTRHYMPIVEGRKLNTTKVLDTFVRTERGATIGVRWDCTPSGPAGDVLHELIARLGYLGRAESVVAATCTQDEQLPDGFDVRPDHHAIDGCEPIRLLAPLDPEAYKAWRQTRLGEWSSLPPTKKGAKKATHVELPGDVVTALQADTGVLQRVGWNMPPGSRQVMYWRPQGALEHRGAPRGVSAAPRVRRDAALLALSSDTSRAEVLPLMSRALPQAELLHRALVSRLGIPPDPCPELSGKDEHGERLLGHRHLHHVPLDLDRDGRLDHILLWAPMGFGDIAERAIRSLRHTWTKGSDAPLYVTLAGFGTCQDFSRIGGPPVPELGESTVWVSRTPFVAPRHVKARRHTLVDQVEAELVSRHLPRACRITVSPPGIAWAAGFQRFVRARRDSDRQPPATGFFHLEIELASPIRGPLTLGYASHFGLGLFVPADPLG